MTAIRPIQNATIFDHIQEAWKDFSIEKVWNAVVNFFRVTAQTIGDALKSAWGCASNAICPVAINSGEPNLREYKNMPQDPVSFVERSVKIFQAVLQTKEEKIIAAAQGQPIPDAQRPLKTFNDDLEGISNIPTVAFAVVKAYVCSDSHARLDFFRQNERVPGEYIAPVVDGDGVLVHGGGQQMRNQTVDRGVRLRELRALFTQLPEAEKEIILDKTDFEGIDRLEISPNGKTILREIGAISNQLHQANPNFAAALQGAHARLYRT